MLRPLFVAALLFFAAPAAASSTRFEQTADEYARAVVECWGVTKKQPSKWEHRRIVEACTKWGRERWPRKWRTMRERLYRLYRSEGENLNDPSFGWWGVTIGAARTVEKKCPVKGYKFPKSDIALAKRLSRDIDFNCYVASGELLLCMKGIPFSYETESVMRYKLGMRGSKAWPKSRKVRRAAWFKIRRQWDCLKRKVVNRERKRCECMRAGKP
jgi:hypothetical protein